MHPFDLKHILLNLIPIGIYVLYIIPGLVFGLRYSSSSFAIVVVLIIITLTPIYLSVLNYHYLTKSLVLMIKLYLFVILVFSLFILTVYVLGGIVTKTNIFNPNDMSMGLTKLSLKYELLLLTISWFIACIVKWCKY